MRKLLYQWLYGHLREYAIFLMRRAPVITTSVIVICFTLTRLPFFLDFSVPDIAIDYWSYFQLIEEWRHGQWPQLTQRTPGYPLFLATVFLFSKSAIAVVVAQCLTTLAASLAALFCFARADRRLIYPVAIALIGFTASMHSVWFDTALMSESLYCSLLMMSIGTLAPAILRGGIWPCVGASLAMIACIMTRPAGSFLFGVYGLALVWFLFQRRPRRETLAFALPFAASILAICAYNKATLGSFTVTPFGAVNALGAVATYIEEDPEAPPAVNAAVRRIQAGVTPEDKATVFTSRDPDALMFVFTRYYDAAIYTHMAKVKMDYMDLCSRYKRLAYLSIRRHPGVYLKFAANNFRKFYENGVVNRNGDNNLYNDLRIRYERATVAQSHIRREGEQIVIDQTWARRLHERFNHIHKSIFSNWLWLFASLLIFPLALWKFARKRDDHAFLALILFLALLGAGLVVALIQMPMTRYGATALFLIYLAPAYSCLPVQQSCMADK